MSINITITGNKVVKTVNGKDIEIHGDEKAFYLAETAKIDAGIGDGRRLPPHDVEEGVDIDWPPNGPRS